MSHIWLGHVTHTNESRTRSVSGIGMGHVTLKNESYHTNKGLISHINELNELNINELNELNESHTRSVSSNRSPSCWNSTRTCIATSQYVMSRIWMSHVTHMNGSYHIYKWVTNEMCLLVSGTFCLKQHSHLLCDMSICHVTHDNEPCHAYKWVMSHK